MKKIKLNLFVFLLLIYPLNILAQYSYNIEVGSYEYLSLDPPAGYVRSATWSVDEGLTLTERSEAGAVVKVSHYFSGAAYVRCSYVYEYLGSYDNNYHAGTGTKTYRITCIGGTAKISETNVALDPGQKITLECIRSRNYGTPEWTSSDENVVTVSSSGKVTAVGSGNATITVDPIIAPLCYCKVSVSKKDPTKIEIVPSQVKVREGKQYKLSYKLLPTGASAKVFWESSNQNIATISSTGMVKAVTPGFTQIVATTENGLSSSATVEVLPLPQQISLITPEPLTVGYQQKMSYLLFPENSEASCVWMSESPIIATVNTTGIVKGRTPGTAVIKVTTENDKTASCRITVKNPSLGMDYRNANVRINAFKDTVKKSLNNIK